MPSLPTDPDSHRHFKPRVHINKNGLHLCNYSPIQPNPTSPISPLYYPFVQKIKHKLYLLTPLPVRAQGKKADPGTDFKRDTRAHAQHTQIRNLKLLVDVFTFRIAHPLLPPSYPQTPTYFHLYYRATPSSSPLFPLFPKELPKTHTHTTATTPANYTRKPKGEKKSTRIILRTTGLQRTHTCLALSPHTRKNASPPPRNKRVSLPPPHPTLANQPRHHPTCDLPPANQPLPHSTKHQHQHQR